MTTKPKKNDSVALNTENKTPVEREVDVLYQRMGDKWYAFSIIDDEVFMGPVENIEGVRGPGPGDVQK
jgi:hypothetical protein